MRYPLPGVLLVLAAVTSCTLDRAGLPTPGAGGASSATAASTTSGPDPTATGAGGGAATSSATTAAVSTASSSTASSSVASSSSATSSTAESASASSSASSGAGGGGPVWTRRRSLDLDCGASCAVEDFTVLVKLDATRIDYLATQPLGQDLRFTDDQGALLDYEVERWDETSDSFAWVRVPTIHQTAVASTRLWMYYGNATAPSAENPHQVWSVGYHGVWHLSERGDALTDSTGKNADAVNHGATVADGRIGRARTFDAASGQYIDTLNSDNLATFTVEVWAKGKSAASAAGGYNGPLMRANNYDIVWDQADPFTASVEMNPVGAPFAFASFNGLSGGTWHYLVGTYDGAMLRSYEDGVLASETKQNAPQMDSATAKIGRHANNTQVPGSFFDGAIDEVRISSKSTTSDWIALQYRSMIDAGFVSFGKEESGSFALP